MHLKTIIFLSTLLAFAVSCKKAPDDFKSDETWDYFPLYIGKYVQFELDSTIYDPTGTPSVYSKTVQMKEEIVDTLRDGVGNLLYKVERYTRAADTLPWQVQKVFSTSIQENQAVVTEDNLRFIKLTFPVRKNNSWNGNIHFNPGMIVTVAGESLEMFKGWNYKIEDLDTPSDIRDFHFEETSAVREADTETRIELRKSRAQYARGVGLIYRELWILDTQCIEACEGQSWEERAEKGFILKQTITAYN